MIAFSLSAARSKFDVFRYRFGQDVVQNCNHCHTFGEYALYAFPGIVLLYLRQAAVVGFITIRGTHRERWRTHGIGLLLFAAIAEVYWTLSVRIQVSGQGSSYEIVMVRQHCFIQAVVKLNS